MLTAKDLLPKAGSRAVGGWSAVGCGVVSSELFLLADERGCRHYDQRSGPLAIAVPKAPGGVDKIALTRVSAPVLLPRGVDIITLTRVRAPNLIVVSSVR